MEEGGIVQGYVEPGFERVRDAFARNFSDDVEVGAGFAAVVDGVTVVDLWGGHQDRDRTIPWRSDTLINVYSTTKGLASAAVAVAVEDGLLDYEAPVASLWPECRAAADGLTVAQMLSHQGGLCGLDRPVAVTDLYDWDRMVTWLAEQAPHWPPGTASGYHAITWGFLAGELVRRATGTTLGQLFRDRIAAPLEAEAYISLPAGELGRVAEMIGPNHARVPAGREPAAPLAVGPLYRIALENPIIRPFKDVCSAAWRQAEIAAANGQATARGIARIYAALGNGGAFNGEQVLSAETIGRATREERSDEPDLVLGRDMRRARGFVLNTDAQYGPGEGSFGHAGAGGSLGFADPELGLGVGYAMNQMQPNLDGDTRAMKLVTALYDVL